MTSTVPARLWRAVLEHPEDDAPREVLSDALQERGDPRGEFIALQLREAGGRASQAEVGLAQALIAEHGTGWLGALRPIVNRAVFRRGLLWRIEVDGTGANAPTWARLAHDPSLEAVEEIETRTLISRVRLQQLVIPFVRSATLKNLRALLIPGDELLKTLPIAALPKLREVWMSNRDEESIAFVARTPQITALRTWHLDSPSVLKRWPATLRQRLTHLSCGLSLKSVKAVWPLFPNLKELSVLSPPVGSSMTITFARGNTSVATVTASTAGGGDLSDLPKSFKIIEMSGNASLQKRLERAAPWLAFVPKTEPSGVVINPRRASGSTGRP